MRGPADLLAWRDEFPAVKSTTFLGAHTLGPLSRRARTAIDGFLDTWERKPSAESIARVSAATAARREPKAVWTPTRATAAASTARARAQAL